MGSLEMQVICFKSLSVEKLQWRSNTGVTKAWINQRVAKLQINCELRTNELRTSCVLLSNELWVKQRRSELWTNELQVFHIASQQVEILSLCELQASKPTGCKHKD